MLRYTGGYTDYLEKREPVEKEPVVSGEKKAPPKTPKTQKLRFSYKEQREYETIDQDIADLETLIAAKEQELNQYVTDYTMLQKLTEEKEALEAKLEEKMERWVYLSELAEQIEAQKQ